MPGLKWKLVAPLTLAAVSALAVGASSLLKKTEKETPEAPAAPAERPVDPMKLRTGSYSFISGFSDPVTVEMRLVYDGDAFAFTVAEEEFLNDTGDSHVGILYGEDFNLQFEYAPYYGGEDFAAHRAHLAEKHPELRELSFGPNQGVLVRDGDNLSFSLPISDDTASFLLVTIQKTPAFDGALEDLLTLPALQNVLSSLRFTRS